MFARLGAVPQANSILENIMKSLLKSTVCAAMVYASSIGWAAGGSTATVLPFPATDNVPGQDAESRLVRFGNSVKIRLRTSGLDPESPYTLWAVIFNRPQRCQTSPCGLGDLPFTPGHDPRVEASIVFAGGGVSDSAGNGDLLGRVQTLAGRAMGEIVLGTGTFDPRKAEIHVVVRGHGYPDVDQLFPALSTFAGGCSEDNPCEDQQFAVHLP